MVVFNIQFIELSLSCFSDLWLIGIPHREICNNKNIKISLNKEVLGIYRYKMSLD
jgi:hypothetical protein